MIIDRCNSSNDIQLDYMSAIYHEVVDYKMHQSCMNVPFACDVDLNCSMLFGVWSPWNFKTREVD